MASRSITFDKELFARYCQSLVDKLTFRAIDVIRNRGGPLVQNRQEKADLQ